MHIPLRVALIATLAGLAGGGCSASRNNTRAAASDTAFAALQRRRQVAMGVDQYTSTHRFDKLPDGGRIELQRNVGDSSGIAQIRRHLQRIAAAFRAGDFSTSEFVHLTDVPGTLTMAQRKDAITYRFAELPRGGEVRIVAQDTIALRAIHEFIDFQRAQHHADGADEHMHAPGSPPARLLDIRLHAAHR